MFKNRFQMNAFLQVAEEMYDSGKLGVKEYNSIAGYIEQAYHNPESFWPMVAEWIEDILMAEDIERQKASLQTLLETYLFAGAADSREEREDILIFVKRIKEFFNNLKKYDQEELHTELQKLRVR